MSKSIVNAGDASRIRVSDSGMIGVMSRAPQVARGTGRAHILSAAVSLIAECGVGAVRLRPVAERAGLSLGSTTYHFADRGELIVAALAAHAATITTTAHAVDDPAEAAAAVRQVYTDRAAALVCAETRLHATRDPRAAELANQVHNALAAAVAVARGRRRAERAPELVAVLNTAAVDAARVHTTPRSYARAMGERVDAALAS